MAAAASAAAEDNIEGSSSSSGEDIDAPAAPSASVDDAESSRTTLPMRRGQPKDAYDLARKKLDKLMAKPDQPVQLPGKKRERKPREPWQFVRNVWGSSAGVGSGDFHIYRGIRRREFERQEYMEKKDAEAKAQLEFEAKVAEKQAQLTAQQAKKRAKRLKKKAKAKAKSKEKKVKMEGEGTGGGETSDSDDDGESEEDGAVTGK